MKKLNILMIMLITSFLFMACEKEENSSSKLKNEIDNKKASTLENPREYRMLTCAYEGDYIGIECVPSEYPNCPGPAPCQPILDDNGDPMDIPSIQNEFGFTDDQTDEWEDGTNILEPTGEFVEEYYDFYLRTYNMGVSLHPDTIIDNLEE